MSNRRVTFFKEVKSYAILPETDDFHNLALGHDGLIYYFNSGEPQELWRRADDFVWRRRLECGSHGIVTGKLTIKVQV